MYSVLNIEMLLILFALICVVIYVVKEMHHLYEIHKAVKNLPILHEQSNWWSRYNFFTLAKFAQNINKVVFTMETTFKYWIGTRLHVVVMDKNDLKVVLQCVNKPVYYKLSPDVFHASGFVNNGMSEFLKKTLIKS